MPSLLENYHCLYAPGIFSERPELCFKKQDLYVDSHKITHSKSRDIIGPDHCCVLFSEITAKPNLLSKALLDLLAYHHEIHNGGYYYGINLANINFAQKPDIEQLEQSYASITTNKKIIIYGTSRGALAVLKFLSKGIPLEVAGIILEGCPSTLEDLIGQAQWMHSSQIWLFKNLWSKFTSYSAAEDNLDFLKEYATHTHRPPILFVTSKMDTVVPTVCTEKVYKLLKQHYSNIKIVSLERATHTDYVTNNTEDSERYYTAVKNFIERIEI